MANAKYTEIESLYNKMKSDLKSAVKDLNALKTEGCDPFDIECDENYNVGYQDAINELGALLGKKPLKYAERNF